MNDKLEYIDGVEYRVSRPRYIAITMRDLGRQLEAAAADIARARNAMARPVLPWEKLDQGAIDGERSA